MLELDEEGSRKKIFFWWLKGYYVTIKHVVVRQPGTATHCRSGILPRQIAPGRRSYGPVTAATTKGFIVTLLWRCCQDGLHQQIAEYRLTGGTVCLSLGSEKDRKIHVSETSVSAHSYYSELNYEINFWRTKSGLEVDFVLGRGEVAVEVKGTDRVENKDLRPLRTFAEEHSPARAILVSNEKTERISAGIRVMPWRRFLDELWSGKIMGT